MATPPAGQRTLLRGLHLLELISQSSGDATVSALSEESGLDKGTTSRLLATLREAGYLHQNPERGYRLTGKVLRFAESYRTQFDFRDLAQHHLKQLRDATGETVHLGIIEGNSVLYIDKVESLQSIKLESRLGHQEPIPSTALGRAILSQLPSTERETILSQNPLTQQTDHTTVDPDEFSRLLDRFTAQGFAHEDQENRPDVTCVAAAVLDATGEVLGAISVSGPSYRMAPRIDDLGAEVRSAAQSLTHELSGDHTGDTAPAPRDT